MYRKSVHRRKGLYRYLGLCNTCRKIQYVTSEFTCKECINK